jgi:hypothetical protein
MIRYKISTGTIVLYDNDRKDTVPYIRWHITKMNEYIVRYRHRTLISYCTTFRSVYMVGNRWALL